MDAVVAGLDGEGPAVAAEDVGGGGAGVSPIVAGAGEIVVGDFARDVSCRALCVDGKGVGRVVRPNLVDVGVEIGLESGRLRGDVVDGSDDTEGRAWSRGLAEVAPGLTIFAGLVDEELADSWDCVCVEAEGGLGAAVFGYH